MLFPEPGGPVDGHDHGAIHTVLDASCSSTLEEAGKARSDRFGPADLDSFAGRRPRHRAEHREPVVAARVDDASAQPGRDAADAEAVRRRADVRAEPAQLLDDRLDPVGSP